MIQFYIFLFLFSFSVADILWHRIPNILTVTAAGISCGLVGGIFLLRAGVVLAVGFALFCLVRALPGFFGLRALGGGDCKVLALLFGLAGWQAAKYILVGFILALVLNIGSPLRRKMILIPYLLGGFLCVELLQW